MAAKQMKVVIAEIAWKLGFGTLLLFLATLPLMWLFITDSEVWSKLCVMALFELLGGPIVMWVSTNVLNSG